MEVTPSTSPVDTALREVFTEVREGKPVSDADRIQSFRQLTQQVSLPTLVPLLPLLLNLNGQPYTLDEHLPMEMAFTVRLPQHLLLKSGRQVTKSTTMAARIILLSNAIGHFSILVVTPLYEQVRRFSTNYVRPFIEQSPVRHLWIGTNTENSVLQRSFRNYSKMYFSFAFLDADRIRGISAHMCCYDREAWVLTSTGWKPIHQITLEDEIADVNDEGVIEWHRPAAVLRKLHTGNMVTFRHRGSRLRVTDDHKMWANFHLKASSRVEDCYEFVAAGALAATAAMGFKLTSAARWPGAAPTTRTLPAVPGSRRRNTLDLVLPYEDFAELVGWYLAEGHVDYSGPGPRMRLTQNAGRHAQLIDACLRRCGLTFSVQGQAKKTFVVNALQLGVYAEPLGDSHTKYIPAEFFADVRLLRPLLRALYLGDACYHQGEVWDQGTLRTRSRRLAEDAQRAWFALGQPATVHTRQMPPRSGEPEEPLYEVLAYKRDYQVYWKADFTRKQRVTVEHVDGEEVYCFTVPHHRPVMKGDFGSVPLISGNCFDEVQDLDHTLLPIIRETMSHSKWRLNMYTGTPKTVDNTMERLWQRSSRAEWCVPCFRCRKLNIPRMGYDLERMIGPWREDISHHRPAVICANSKCGEIVNPAHGRWYHEDEARKLTNPGYHIPQVIMPLHYANGKMWAELLGKQSGAGNTTAAQFYNEVLGESYDVGTKLISETELKATAILPWVNKPREPQEAVARKGDYLLRVLGVDWGGGGEGEVSFTKAAVLGFRSDGRLDVVYGRQLLNPQDHLREAEELLHIFNMFDCHFFAHDYNGAGSIRETLMVQSGLPYDRVIPLVYFATATKNLIVFHKSEDRHSRNFWQLDKARALLLVCNCLKLKWIRTFQHDFVNEDNPGLLNDFLALQENKIEMARGRDIYTVVRNPHFSDDFAHAVTFAACTIWHHTGNWPNLASLAGLQLTVDDINKANPPQPWEDYGDE